MAFVQLVFTAAGTSSTSLATPPFTSTTGNNIIVFCVIGNSSIQTVQTVTDGPLSFAVASVANSSGGSAVYTGTFTGGGSNAFAGTTFGVSGFSTGSNNGTFLCTASSATTLTLSNGAAVAQSATANASSTINIYQLATGAKIGSGVNSGTELEIWYSFGITGGTQAVTQHWSTSAGGYSQIYAAEYSGGTFTFDSGNAVSSTGTVPQITNTTTYWNDLIVACAIVAGQTIPSVWANEGWGAPTDRQGGGGLVFGDLVATTPSAYLMSGTVGTNAAFGFVTASFKLPSGANQYEWINAGAGVQLPVVGLAPGASAPGSPDASMLLASPEMVSTPAQGEIPSGPVNYSSPLLPSTPLIGEIPGFINFTSPLGPIGTPTTSEMPATYFLILNMFNGGFSGAQWITNAFVLGQDFWDKTTTIYSGQLYPVPESDTAQAGDNEPSGLGQTYPTASKRRNYPY